MGGRIGIILIWSAIAVGALLLAGPMLGLLLERGASTTASRTVRQGGLLFRTQVAPAALAEGGTATLRLTVSNVGREPLRGLRIEQVAAPGFRRIGGCWDMPADLLCWPGVTAPSPPSSPRELKPGETLTGRAELAATESAGDHEIALRTVWEGGAALLVTRPVALVTANGLLALHAVRGYRVLLELLENLALPLVLLALGFLVKNIESDRAETHQTWAQMLPKHHENSERYYVPLCSFLLSLTRKLPEEPAAPSDCRRSFFYLMMFFKLFKTMQERIGGFYLKDRKGEDVLTALYHLLFLGAEKGKPPYLPYETRMKALAVMSERPEYARFEKLFWNPHFHRLEEGFYRWMTTGNFRDEMVPVCEALRLILRFELNRPQEKWYGRSEPFRIEADQEKQLQKALELVESSPIEEDRQTMRVYLEAMLGTDRQRILAPVPAEPGTEGKR